MRDIPTETRETVMATLDKNGYPHADAGGEVVDGKHYEGGAFLPTTGKSEANATTRRLGNPKRVLVALSLCEEFGVSHGKSWVYSYKKNIRSLMFSMGFKKLEASMYTDFSEDMDGNEVCYAYPTWEQVDEFEWCKHPTYI